MEKKDRAMEPAPQDSYFVRDPATDADRAFVSRVISGLSESYEEVRDYHGGHRNIVIGRMGEPVNGKVRLTYDMSEKGADIYWVTYWNNPKVPCEFVEAEYNGVVFGPESEECRTLRGIEEGYACRREEERMRRVRERVRLGLKGKR